MGTVLNWGNPLHRPCLLFLLGFGVITAYIPGILGAAISTGWLFLFITVPVFLLFCDIKFGFGFAFICYAALSLLWTENLNIAWFHFLQIVILGCVFHIGRNVKDLTTIFKGLAFGLGLASVAAIAQKFGFREIVTLDNSTAGLFVNPNIYSEISAVLLVSLIILKLWWWIPACLSGLILVQSRAAFVGLGVGLFIWAWKINKYLAVTITLFVALLGVYFYWGRFDISSIQERLDLWADTIQGFKLFGNGVGSFEIMYPFYATHIDTELARPRYAHNHLLNLIFEFGIGSTFFILVIWNVYKSSHFALPILFTIAAISMVTYPIHVPATAFIAFLVAGYCIGGNDTNRNIRTGGRSILSEGHWREGLSKIRSGCAFLSI